MTEQFWVSDEQWERDPAAAHDVQLSRPLPGDGNPIHLTAYEAQKCQAVIRGYLDGDQLYRHSVELVAQLLSVRALTAVGVPHAAADPWPAIAAAPWPPSRDQSTG